MDFLLPLPAPLPTRAEPLFHIPDDQERMGARLVPVSLRNWHRNRTVYSWLFDAMFQANGIAFSGAPLSPWGV